MYIAQRSFGFLQDLPTRPDRPECLFFGLLPDAEAARDVEALADRFVRARRLRGRLLRRRRLHVSLHHVGDYRRLLARFVFAAQKSAQAVKAFRFELTFFAIGSFEGPDYPRQRDRPLVLFGKSEGLRALHSKLGAAMRATGLRAGTTFTPHMTLFYGLQQTAAEPIEPVRVEVGEFVLIHSELGLGRHTVLDRWPLAG